MLVRNAHIRIPKLGTAGFGAKVMLVKDNLYVFARLTMSVGIDDVNLELQLHVGSRIYGSIADESNRYIVVLFRLNKI
jgi:hypothetical protein